MAENRFSTKRAVKKVKFIGEDLDIVKLSVSQVMEIQALAKTVKEGDEASNIDLLLKVVRSGTPEFVEFENDEFMELPMDELASLSNAIMKHSGLIV